MFFTGRRRPSRQADSRLLLCQDNTGRRSTLLVTLDQERLVLSQRYGVAVVLTPTQAGRLRAVLRELILASDERA